MSEELKIYRYIEDAEAYDQLSPPFSVNINSGLTRALHKKKTRDKGYTVKKEWFASCAVDPATGMRTHSDLVAYSAITRTFDPNGFPLSRDETIHYLKEDETECEDTKDLSPFVYPLQDSIKAAKGARGNVVDDLEMKVVGLLIQTQPGTMQEKIDLGRQFVADHKTAIDLFVGTSERSIFTEIQNGTESWLDTPLGGGLTIRLVMMDAVDIWGLMAA